MSDLLCIYHGNCADGFGAAMAVWKKYGDNCEFYAGIYGEEPPDCKDKNVIIVDFSYKKDVMMKIINDCKSLIVLDHHKSAEEELFGLDVLAPRS
jgi:oligoribonuclease NrnB/cAMP/cGMP phosphodiesterase (DHH superfamily)